MDQIKLAVLHPHTVATIAAVEHDLGRVHVAVRLENALAGRAAAATCFVRRFEDLGHVLPVEGRQLIRTNLLKSAKFAFVEPDTRASGADVELNFKVGSPL